MLKMSTLAVAASLSATMLLSATGAQAAQQIFSTFGPNTTFGTFGPPVQGFLFGNISGVGNTYTTVLFTTPTSVGSLDHIDLAVCQNAGSGVVVDLLKNFAEVPSGDVVGHWVIHAPSCFSGKLAKVSVSSTKSVPLVPNQLYWVVAGPASADAWRMVSWPNLQSHHLWY